MNPTLRPPGSQVDFSDPALQRAVGLMGGSNKCCYFLPLAAWQRGLTVEFFGTQADARVNIPNMPKSSAIPELFMVSDGQRQHFFNRSMGDHNTLAVSNTARDKVTSKRSFVKAGVTTPDHVVWHGANMAEVRAFLARHPDAAFVTKPISGSHSAGVQVNLPAGQVVQDLSNRGAVRTLVEHQIDGLEHRVYVVGPKVAAAFAKPGISVIGNGRQSIAQLVVAKNAQRAANPALASCQIDLADVVQYLGHFGQTVGRVPVFGERVVLSTLKGLGAGADGYNVTDTLDPTITQMAVAACQSVGVPNAAVDVIFDGVSAYVLELNERAMIAGHTFPTVGTGTGNAVAEAIIDWYFPTPDGSAPPRHTGFLDNTELLSTFARLGTKARYKFQPLQP